MNYLPQDFARCEGTHREQCQSCLRNVRISPVHPEALRQVWIGPWIGHGPCPEGGFLDKDTTPIPKEIEPHGY